MIRDVEAEAGLRIKVAVCTRVLAMDGLLDYSGHVGARLADGTGFLVQPRDVPRSEVAPEDILVCGMDGRPVPGSPAGIPPREVHIHAEILAARPDVSAVCHFHPETATVFSLLEDRPLVPVKNHASRWAEGIPVHPDPGHVSSAETGKALAATLGNRNAALMRAHGAVVVAESVPALLADCLHFEENARTLWNAAAIGKVRSLSAKEMSAFTERFDRDRHVRKLWRQALARGTASGAVPEWGRRPEEEQGAPSDRRENDRVPAARS